jgi:hypothetical protein
MSYLAEQTTKDGYGVVRVGDYIVVDEGIITLEQDVSPNASVNFVNLDVANNLYADGNLVITSVTPSAGNGINLSNVTTTGYEATFTIENTGVLSLNAGPGISLTANTGIITVSATGADLISVYGTTTSYTATANDEYIGVFSASPVTISLPVGINGRVYYIKDEYGQGSGKITIDPNGSETIDGKATYVISVPYQCVGIVFRAGQWRII